MENNITKKPMTNKKQTAVEWLINKLELFNLTKEEHYETLCHIQEEAKKIGKQQMIDFHVSVMKKGLIKEGDREWTDAYLPKIREVAEQCYIETYEQ